MLDLGEDLLEAADDDKDLVIFWEQRGCPYCVKMHEVNLRIPRIASIIALIPTCIERDSLTAF